MDRHAAILRNGVTVVSISSPCPTRSQPSGPPPGPAQRPQSRDAKREGLRKIASLHPCEADSDLLDAKRLAERYEDEAFVGIKDLACVAKFTIDKRDRILAEWPRIVRFAAVEFAEKRNMACIAVLHVPARSGVRRDAHVHLVAPARELGPDGYGAFLRPFATDAGGPEIARAWAARMK